MAFRTNCKVFVSYRISPLRYFSNTNRNVPKLPYEIPERYRNAFYLANASLFDSTNWFLHRAYEVAFPNLKNRLSKFDIQKTTDNDEKIEEIIKILDQCNSIIDVRFPVKRDSGSHEIIRGFRAHNGLSVGYTSCLGGFRIHENITRDQMKGLSVLSTFRNACMGINMGGAHGGIKICPKHYSPNELQRIVELYVTELIRKGYSGDRDISQADINTSEREMMWIHDTYSKITGQSPNVASTGKSSYYGSIDNYQKMSSQGAFYALDFFLNNEEIMKKVDLTKGMTGKTFIIQGLGKLGAPLAELLVDHGAICVGVKEHDAYLYDSKGINLKELFEYREKNGSIINYSMAKPETNDSIYTEPCDILVFSAHHKALVCYVANNVKAKVILEAADAPVTPTSHRILTGKSKLIVPDIYACSGATVASYLEYLKNMQHMGVAECDLLRFSGNIYKDILNRLDEKQSKVAISGDSSQRLPSVIEPAIISNSIECILTDVGNEIVKLLDVNKLGTDVRTAAYMIGIENMFNAIFYQKKFI